MIRHTVFATALLATLAAPIASPAAASQMNAQTLEVLNVTSHVPNDYADFLKQGNVIMDGQVISKGKTRVYRMTIQQCRTGIAFSCLGGATLTITRETIPSTPPHYTYTAKMALLR